MFFRGSQSAHRNQSGLGIGLPLAGFDHHLVKPADLGTLQSLITSIQAERH